jgi:hypothetical protein
MSEYNKLKAKGMKKGRPKFTGVEKQRSMALAVMRQEARRRAHLVLKSRHSDEYSEIYEAELSALANEPSAKELGIVVANKQSKKTRKTQ